MAKEMAESPNTRRAKMTERKLRQNAAMEEIWKRIPAEIIRPTVHPITGEKQTTHFIRGAFLGKGGFARVYEMKDARTGETFAGKIVSKKSLTKPRSKQKLVQEIRIHKALHHDNIVKFVNFVEDKEFVYIILEMCSNRSLLKMIRSRKYICEAELRYYLNQMVSGLVYLKKQNVIHRDLKLGNLFLNHEMKIKMGDFGLAAKLTDENERKKTICGTPNYIAPEILRGGDHGHSFEVDVWSLGVVMYTLLVGKPPFETSNLKTTYQRITAVSYSFPAKRTDISDEAKDLVRLMLNQNPAMRPKIDDIQSHAFLANARIPKYLPPSSMELVPVPRRAAPKTVAESDHYWINSPAVASARPSRLPAIREAKKATRSKQAANFQKIDLPRKERMAGISAIRMSPGRMLSPNSKMTTCMVAPSAHIVNRVAQLKSPLAPSAKGNIKADSENIQPSAAPVAPVKAKRGGLRHSDTVLAHMAQTLTSALGLVEGAATMTDDEDIVRANSQVSRLLTASAQSLIARGLVQKPSSSDKKAALAGNVMVSRWVDYTPKYGLVYQLSNRCTGISFVDGTKIIFNPSTNMVDYMVPLQVEGVKNLNEDKRFSFHFASAPASLKKKMDLLVYFRCYYSHSEVETEEMEERMSRLVVEDSEKLKSDSVVYVQKWIRKKRAILFRLSDGNVQVNFMDHNKLLLWAGAEKVLFINPSRSKLSYEMKQILCAPLLAKRSKKPQVLTTREDLQERLSYVQSMMLQLCASSKLGVQQSGKQVTKKACAPRRPRSQRVLVPST